MSFLSRIERLGEVDSTQRVVRSWLDAGVPEVAVATARYQSAGRGRRGRSWHAPPGAALLLSAGFRPDSLSSGHAWHLPATVSLAMIDAAEEAAGLKDGTLWLKWPNDIVAQSGAELLKVSGVLGEAVMANASVDWSVVGIGINTDWSAADFPAALAETMTSLRELAGGRPIDNEVLLDAFLARLEPRYEALRQGAFDMAAWSTRQVVIGRRVEVDVGDHVVSGTAIGLAPETGALTVETDDARRVAVQSGDVVRCHVVRPPRSE